MVWTTEDLREAQRRLPAKSLNVLAKAAGVNRRRLYEWAQTGRIPGWGAGLIILALVRRGRHWRDLDRKARAAEEPPRGEVEDLPPER